MALCLYLLWLLHGTHPGLNIFSFFSCFWISYVVSKQKNCRVPSSVLQCNQLPVTRVLKYFSLVNIKPGQLLEQRISTVKWIAGPSKEWMEQVGAEKWPNMSLLVRTAVHSYPPPHPHPLATHNINLCWAESWTRDTVVYCGGLSFLSQISVISDSRRLKTSLEEQKWD